MVYISASRAVSSFEPENFSGSEEIRATAILISYMKFTNGSNFYHHFDGSEVYRYVNNNLIAKAFYTW